MPLPPPVIKIVSFVSFIIKCPAPIKNAQLPGTAYSIHRPVSISPLVVFTRPSPDGHLWDSRPDFPERFHHLPTTQSAMVVHVSSSQSANPIAKAPRLHYHQIGLTRPVGQNRNSLQC